MNTFDLFIYAVAAFALIAVFLAIAQNFPQTEDTSTIIKTALNEARLDPNLGKTFSVGALDYEKERLINSSGLQIQGTMLSIECTDPNYCCIRASQENQSEKCDKYFEWDYDFIRAIKTKKINTFVRCVDIDTINSCKVFVGLSPAQAKVISVENIGTNSSGNTEIKATVSNAGSTPLSLGVATVKLFKKVDEDWESTNYDSDPQEAILIQPNEEKILYWEINPVNLGTYRVTIRFEANEAGFDENHVDFNKTENSSCKVQSIGDTVYSAENNNYQEIHSCEGCNYAYECANAWSKKNPNVTFYPQSRDYSYCIKQTEEGNC